MEKLTDILKDLEKGKISADNAEDKVLRLFGVSGNEDIPLSKNKNAGEVALPPANHRWEIADEFWEICRCGCGLARERRQ